MTDKSGPLYEVTIFVAPDVAEACDELLDEHVRSALRDPSIAECTAYARDSDAEGRQQRVCLHTLVDDDVLDDFVDGPGSELEAQLDAQFGDQVERHTRLLREDPTALQVSEESPNCLNCGSRLRGQYCGNCGQRSRSRLISLWELVSDAFGDLLELDSRLWKTLIPLMIRPGQLTADYLQGKRARFMPPFRMYLVLSLVFFVVAFFNPREELSLFFEPEPEPTEEELAEQEAAAVAERSDAQEVLDELVAEGVIDAEDLDSNVRLDSDGLRVTVNGEEVESDDGCNVDASDLEDMPDWLARRMTVERLQHICDQIRLDDGRSLGKNMLDNIPAALIILLPLMAFVLKALYPLSKRYYVEHLLFFVHFHAFFFLMLTLQFLSFKISRPIGIPLAVPIILTVLTSFYIAIYLFVAMRRVYGQGRFITLLKYIPLLVAYLAGFTLTMLGALAIAAFSI